jgi:hypothetical protein
MITCFTVGLFCGIVAGAGFMFWLMDGVGELHNL